LPGGQVLVVGGESFEPPKSKSHHHHSRRSRPISDAELYDPATGVWTVTNSLNLARFSHTATLLPNEQVLIAGGTSGSGRLVFAAELYHPSTGTWTAT